MGGHGLTYCDLQYVGNDLPPYAALSSTADNVDLVGEGGEPLNILAD